MNDTVSTGLIFDRLWAAIKREALYIMAEGVADPEEIDHLWTEMWTRQAIGPVAMMDQVGLDSFLATYGCILIYLSFLTRKGKILSSVSPSVLSSTTR
jgi:3-hydroxyacyl-CoA dehydrogenase